MATVVTHTCDLCSATWIKGEKGKQLWRMTVGITDQASAGGDYLHQRKGADWCRDCAVKHGFLPQIKTDPPRIEPEPTIQDLVRAIVQEELEAVCE